MEHRRTMWSVDDVNFEEEEENSNKSKEIEIDYNQFLIELAYHEASHFVFDQLILKMDLGFHQIESIFVHCEKESKTIKGVVSGLGKSITDLRKFYKADTRRVYARLITTLAGYTSRTVFIKDDIDSSFFISKADLSDNYKNGMLYYYSIEIAPSAIDDIRKTKAYLKEYLQVKTTNDKDIAIHRLVSDIQSLMETPAIHSAIGYVKNTLVKNNGTQIVGKELNFVKLKTGILLSKVSLEDTIEKYLCN